MKKMILGLAFSAGALFGAEPSSSSSAPDPGYSLPSLGHSSEYTHYNPGHSETPWEKLEEAFAAGPHIFVAKQPAYQVLHHTYEPQVIRHEKGNLLDQAAETAVHVSAQTLFSLLMQDVYSGIKNLIIPNDEAAFQESIAKLKLQQAQNNEKEREIGIQMAQVNVKMIDEMRELVTVVRTLSAKAAERTLSNEETEQLNSAKYSLSILQGILKAASSAA